MSTDREQADDENQRCLDREGVGSDESYMPGGALLPELGDGAPREAQYADDKSSESNPYQHAMSAQRSRVQRRRASAGRCNARLASVSTRLRSVGKHPDPAGD